MKTYKEFGDAIRRCESIGMPFVYEGIQYKVFTENGRPRHYIICSVADARAIPETLHILEGTWQIQNLGGLPMKKVILPASLRLIDRGAFKGCKLLDTVEIVPNCTLFDIGEEAFMDCVNLKHINLQNITRLSTVHRRAFYNCDSLEEIWLPPDCGQVQEEAFSMCNALRCIHLSLSTCIPASFKKLSWGTRTRKAYYD